MVSRRTFLSGVAIGPVISLSGCIDTFRSQNSEEQDPITVNQIEIVNGQEGPVSITVVIQSSDDVIYWQTHQLTGSEEDGSTIIVDGPTQEEAAKLELLSNYETVDGDPNENGHNVINYSLGQSAKNCIDVRLAIGISGGIHIREEMVEDGCEE